MEKYSFFNSVNGDRRYDATDWANWFADFFKNGVFNNGLKVSPGSGMQIVISEGTAFAKGYKYQNTSDLTKNITIADGEQDRIDNVVLRLDLTNRTFLIQIVQGDYASDPVAPSLVRDSIIYDLRIAKIYISAGTTEITKDMITDCRFISDDCGNVIQAIQEADLTDIFEQCYLEAESAKNRISNILSGDVAGNLFNTLNTLIYALGLNNNTHDTTKTYSKGDLVVYNYIIYECNEDNTTGDFDNEKWTIVPILKF